MSTKFAMSKESGHYVRAAQLAELQAAGCLAVQLEGHALALFTHDDQIYAVDNRCPHMGFPLHRGTVKDGVLTCHWHHARFDLASGGTFDPSAPANHKSTSSGRGDGAKRSLICALCSRE